MKRIREAAREVDVVHETEVLVVGSGPGGLAAALASARAGARTTLLERHGCFGGNITAGRRRGLRLVPPREDRRQRGHRHRVRGARQGDGRRDAGAAVDQPRARRRDVQVGRRRPGRGSGHHADAASAVRRADPRGRRDPRASSPRARRAARRSSRAASSTARATPTSPRARARAVAKTPREAMMAASVMFSMSGVNKRRFIEAVKADPQTYRDWVGNGEWNIETDRQGGRAVLAVPAQALQAGGGRGRHSAHARDDRRHLGRGQRPGRPHLPQPRQPAGDRRHRSGRPHARRDRGAAAGDPRDRGPAQVHARLRRRRSCATSA